LNRAQRRAVERASRRPQAPSPLLMWRYAQRKGGPREYAAEVRIEGVA